MAGAPGGRRWFMRSATGAALAMVTVGTQALLGPASASAQARAPSCCALIKTITAWCPLICTQQNQSFHCWTCNNNRCKCCECSAGTSCYRGATLCSYQVGCC